MVVVLRFDDGETDTGLVGEDVIGALLLLAAGRHPPADDDAPIGESELFAHLEEHVPPGPDQRWRDELRADVALAEAFFI